MNLHQATFLEGNLRDLLRLTRPKDVVYGPEKEKLEFVIKTKERTYELQAGSAGDLHEWVKASPTAKFFTNNPTLDLLSLGPGLSLSFSVIFSLVAQVF